MSKVHQLSLWCAAALVAPASAALAQEPAPPADAVLGEVSVTATRLERPTKEVPQAVNVISAQEIKDQRMTNVGEAMRGTPGVLVGSENGGYDARLVIRGAGVKARYGIREIMILRDGVPVTDPDSFSRLDFVDPQDIEQIEIVKGPGNVFAGGSVGGVVQILSKSVFDETSDVAKVGLGTEDNGLAHVRVGGWVDDTTAVRLTASHREATPDWRRWNDLKSDQVSLKGGRELANGGLVEAELSYAQVDMQLPGSMDQALFDTYQRTGEQRETGDAWKHSARDSKSWFLNARYEGTVGEVTVKPRLYVNRWEHIHPVTAGINVNPGNWVYGGDVQADWGHALAGHDATLVGGVSYRRDEVDGQEKYEYADVAYGTAPFFGAPRPIIATLSDRKGTLMESEDSVATLYGVFANETVDVTDRLTVDAGLRVDRATFDITTEEFRAYNWGFNAYEAGAGTIQIDTQYTLVSPRLGLSYALTPRVNVYGTVSQGEQVPSTSELGSNPALETALSTNYEIGLKGRGAAWQLDLAAYWNPVENEITQVSNNGQSVYQNAGQTLKRGLEVSGALDIIDDLTLGAHYALSDYTFDDFTETIPGRVATTRELDGNRLPFVPLHQYGLFARWQATDSLWLRGEANSWGRYYMDNANTQSYEGYDLVTSLAAGWEEGRHALRLSVENLFDSRYAVEAKKDASGNVSYSGAAPRTVLLTYEVKL